MYTYAVYRQYFPVTTKLADPRRGIDAEYSAAIVFQGHVSATDTDDAIAQAQHSFGLLVPIVERVLH